MFNKGLSKPMEIKKRFCMSCGAELEYHEGIRRNIFKCPKCNRCIMRPLSKLKGKFA